MNSKEIDNYLDRFKYKRYSTGVLYFGPDWLNDIRALIDLVTELNNFKKHCEENHSLPDICCPEVKK